MTGRSQDVVWNCFAPEADVDIAGRNRPHWDQAGAVTFVTIRLDDSMPKEVVKQWIEDQKAWLAARGWKRDSDLDMILSQPDAPRSLQRALIKYREQRWNEDLDRCHGACILRDRVNATIVADSLTKFDGERYDLERFVIMPNHIHLLLQMRTGWRLRQQCESWTRFSARVMHAQLGKSGACWAEPFDHVVRNVNQFTFLREYIVDNPKKACLTNNEYLLWIRHTGFVE